MRRRRLRRRLSMTSLIDVIFLLLLFFMLSSTFSRFAEVELAASGSGQASQPITPAFLSLKPESLSLNGVVTDIQGIGPALAAFRSEEEELTLLISLKTGVTAQRLTDVLATLRPLPSLRVMVLGAS
ncbi:MAG: biopolymer transporter ExbD [Thalassococcus sp.]|uniref:ExbD/TolR family protein n=1 Tax=Thalassococcus sp. TaxID=1928858 RepID=UPI001B2E41A8|nr:biopolymer transporter ExbD [Thalassococcus sp.]MBO6867115.1 biopolymer transporter ExbD [Thalassococcus sp.]